MTKFVVEKSGPLRGEVTISGAKNSVLPILAATLLSSKPCEIDEVPNLKDVEILCSLLDSLGVGVNKDIKKNTVSIDAEQIATNCPPTELVEKMRASILVMGPLLARTGRALIHLPGGCAIGEKP